MNSPHTTERFYSSRLRTAVVLTGSGTAGAYHAGVLRALQEAGVRTDVVAGRGMGAVSAMFAAVDGGSRLWEPTGVWKGRSARSFYLWRKGLQGAAWAAIAAGVMLCFPILLFACAIVVGLVGLLMTLVGLEQAGSALHLRFTSWLAALFTPTSLPTVVPRLVLLAVLVAIASLAASAVASRLGSGRRQRRQRAGPDAAWRLVAHPLSAAETLDTFAAELWKLIRGAAPLQQPRHVELGRRYLELLSENLGQPGFRELLVVVHDLDARRDVVFAFLTDRHRPRFFAGAATARPGHEEASRSSGAASRGSADGVQDRLAGAEDGPGDPARPASLRAVEAFDLSGVAREHAMDALTASLALPLATRPHLVTFAPEGPWRGESHQLCDRPAALGRVLEEVAAAGAEQVVVVSSSPRAGRPHELSARRTDMRGTAGEQLAAFESAGLCDVLDQYAGRFGGLYVIRPEHNPIGALDFSGVYDERSDRHCTISELVDRGYEDAYRQFIDPVVGASGERMEMTR